MSKRQRGDGGLIKKKGCRFWYLKYKRPDGKVVEESSHSENKSVAGELLRERMVGIAKGIAPASNKRVTYGDLRQALLLDYKAQGRKSLDNLPHILAPLDRFFDWCGTNHGWPVTRINPDAIRQFVRERQDAGAGNAIINRNLAALRRMFILAVEDGRVQSAPKIRFLKESPARKGFLELEDFHRLLAKLPAEIKPLVTFLYFCGVRIGEARAIQWPQVDLSAAVIRLESEQTKNAEPRTVPLPDVLVRMLAQVRTKTGLVFYQEDFRGTWTAATQKTGLSGLMVHDLRRSAVRNLVRAGVSETVAMAISGHKTRAIFQRYNITAEADVTKAMRLVEQANGHSPKQLPAARIECRRTDKKTA